MHSYKAEQVTIEIPTKSGSVRIGGRPGLVPTAMVGSIFYSGDKLVIDPKTGKIDREGTEEVLNRVVDISERTGIPNILDIVAETPAAMSSYVRYLCDIVDMPLMIDGSGSLDVNLAGLETARESGIMDRVILNSIGPEENDDVYSKLVDLGLKTAMLLAFKSEAMASSDMRVALAKVLIERASNAGIENLMIDTGVMDLLTLGLSTKAISRIKDETGIPSGCGAHNAVNMWKNLVPKFGKKAKKPAMVGSSLVPITMGADFILYGPVKNATIIFPSVAMVDVALSGGLIEEGKRPKRPHPRYLIG